MRVKGVRRDKGVSRDKAVSRDKGVGGVSGMSERIGGMLRGLYEKERKGLSEGNE